MRERSLPYRLSTLIVGAAGLILALLIFYNHRTTGRIMEERIRESINSITGAAMTGIEERMSLIEDLGQNYAAFLINREFSRDDAVQIVLSELLEQDSLLVSASLKVAVPGEGSCTEYSALRGSGKLHKVKCERITPWNGPYGRGRWSDPLMDSLSGQRIIALTYPVLHIDRDSITTMGMLSLHVPMFWINEIVSDIQVYESGEAYLLRQDGLFLTHPRRQYAGEWTIQDASQSIRSPDLLAFLDSIQVRREGFLEIESYFSGRSRGILTYKQVFRENWFMVLLFKENEYLAEFRKLNRRLGSIGISAMALLSLLVFLIIRRLTRPITELTALTEEIAGGGFDLSLPEVREGREARSLSTSIRKLQDELKDYIKQLEQTIREKERIEGDMRVASQIQSDLIPSSFPPPEELGGLDIYGRVIPARWVSGDLLTYLQTDEDHLVFMLGDVTGKGVPASLFMAITRTLVLIESQHGSRPAEILQKVNKELCRDNPQSVFVTAILGIVDLSSGKLEYSNAGHLPPYIVGDKKGAREEGKAHGVPLGLFPTSSYGSSAMKLEKGEYFLCFSDGLPEAENEAGDFYGDERLAQYLANLKEHRAGSMVDYLIQTTDEFRGERARSDDLSVLAVGYPAES